MRPPWDEITWRKFDASMAKADWHAIARQARHVLKSYSTSFFLVTRFLPPQKRAEVEVIYAAVRYPDEVVDSFPVTSTRRLELLQEWADGYEAGLRGQRGVPPFLSAFTEVVRRREIPPEHYRSFLEAMRLDVEPRLYISMDDLIDSYVYGSAIVVGYFLAYVYGGSDFPRILASSRALGIALQLTNFLRDVSEDRRRGRVYLPQDLLRAQGIVNLDVDDPTQLDALNRVLRQVSAIAEEHYAASERDLDAFAPDCVTAIRACIDVYRQLNLRIGRSAEGVRHRESVPLATKFHVLPPSKYWKLPLAWLGAI
jgi:phytoene synthase